MFQKFKFVVDDLLSNPNTRAILILNTLLIAALAGGAPHDGGGWYVALANLFIGLGATDN